MPPHPRPRPPRAPARLKLRPIRSGESVALDNAEHRGTRLPPYVQWRDFYRDFARDFDQGQHITSVGGTGSGKTTLLRQLILLRTYVVVLATKVRDDSLYRPLYREGFETTETFASDPEHTPRVILKPPLRGVTLTDRQAQRDAFADALGDIWQTGRWCVFADEIRYLTDNLRLATEIETLWLQGRSLDVSVVCGTQRPVAIPLEAFSQATHLFLFRENDRRNVERMSEFTAGDVELARYVIPRLPPHEALYVHTMTGRMLRTKVVL